MHKVLEEDGINLMLNTTAKEFIDKGSNISVVLEQDDVEKTIEGDIVFIALGRKPSSSNLNLEKIGVTMEVFKMNKTILIVIMSIALIVLGGCTPANTQQTPSTDTVEEAEDMPEAKVEYKKISAKEAKAIMDSQEEHIIVDVRTQAEYDSGHIDGAILVPLDQIEQLAPKMLPDYDKQILLYCRSGNRSAVAARILIDMGYTNVKDFGGIIDWPY